MTHINKLLLEESEAAVRVLDAPDRAVVVIIAAVDGGDLTYALSQTAGRSDFEDRLLALGVSTVLAKALEDE